MISFQLNTFQYGIQPPQPPLTPQDACSPSYVNYSPATPPASVNHIRLFSPIPDGGIPPTPPTPNSGGKGGRFGILSDMSLTPEMKEFIESFRTRRIALGYTQEDVGFELSRTNGPSYSQSFISRFESKNLGLKAAEKMKPVMQSWLEQKELENAKGLRVCKKRKRRTSFSNEVLRMLINQFERNPKPSSADIAQIAKEVDLEPVTIRVWFCNRKQMLKRMATGKVRVNNSLKAELEAKYKVPSPSKDSKFDFTHMPVGQFSFTEDRVKPLVCVASEGSPVKNTPRTSSVTYAQVQDDTIVHATAPGFTVTEPSGQHINQLSFSEGVKTTASGFTVTEPSKHINQLSFSDGVKTVGLSPNKTTGDTSNHVTFPTDSLTGTHVEHSPVASLNFDSSAVQKHLQYVQGVDENTIHEYQSDVAMPEHS